MQSPGPLVQSITLSASQFHQIGRYVILEASLSQHSRPGPSVGTTPVIVRQEQPSDVPQIRKINRRAFKGPGEANIVDALRESCPHYLSLVAQMGDKLVGHILFTPVTVQTAEREIQGMGLAPMSVLPEHQRKGIGSELVHFGIEKVREAGYPFIVVLGHPTYYPRFGFEQASMYGLTCEYAGVPDEAFMVLALEKAALKGVSGVVKYRPEFAAAI